MNRHKSTALPTPRSTFVTLILTTIIAASGGIQHAIYKNRQVQMNRDIDAIERHIEQYKLDIRTTQMRTDHILNRFAIRKQLADAGSPLRPIPLGLPEEVNPAPPAAVASVVP